MGQRMQPVAHLPVDTAEWLFEHLCHSRRSLMQHFPRSPLFFFIPIIGSCMPVESLSAPYDSLNGEGGCVVGGAVW